MQSYGLRVRPPLRGGEGGAAPLALRAYPPGASPPMAIFHLDISVISRSAGRSSTAAAAYRLAARIEDQRTGLTHDYRRKTGVVASGVVGWEQGAMGALWNSAEAAETRRNACTAREVMVALPAELNAEQQARLIRGFAAHLRDRYGVAATWAIHAAPKGGDERNAHAHILMTTRKVDADGRFGEKTRALDDRRQGPEEIKTIRLEWEKRVNRELEKTGSTTRVASRKRSVEPLEHLGPVATAQERRGIRTRAGDRNRRRLERRGRASALVREIRTLQQEQAAEDQAEAQAAARAEQAKAEALEAAARKIKAEAEAQRRRAEQAAQREAAVAAARDDYPGILGAPGADLDDRRRQASAVPIRETPAGGSLPPSVQAAAVWTGVLDNTRTVDDRAKRLAAQLGVMEDQQGRQALLAEIKRAAPVGVRRDCWAVLRTIAEKAREVAAATYRGLLAEVRRLADSEDRARPRQGQRQR